MYDVTAAKACCVGCDFGRPIASGGLQLLCLIEHIEHICNPIRKPNLTLPLLLAAVPAVTLP
jgi:hypothetical protein